MEATKCLKPSGSGSRIGDRASVQAATRVNAEQASKRSMCRPTRQPFRGRLIRPGEMSEEYAQLLHRGSGGSMYTRKAHATREAPWPPDVGLDDAGAGGRARWLDCGPRQDTGSPSSAAIPPGVRLVLRHGR